VIYDDDYYTLTALSKNKKFKQEIRKLEEQFRKFGYPIPREGFKSLEEYHKWRENLYQKYLEVINSPEYRKKEQKITKGKKVLGEKEYKRLENFRKKNLPPINHLEAIRDILKKFDLKSSKWSYQRFIFNLLFFKKKNV